MLYVLFRRSSFLLSIEAGGLLQFIFAKLNMGRVWMNERELLGEQAKWQQFTWKIKQSAVGFLRKIQNKIFYVYKKWKILHVSEIHLHNAWIKLWIIWAKVSKIVFKNINSCFHFFLPLASSTFCLFKVLFLNFFFTL